MKWLAVTGDLAFNIMFAALAFASIAQTSSAPSWTPFVAPDGGQELRVFVRPSGAVIDDGRGDYRGLAADDVKDKIVILHVAEEYPGVVRDLVALKQVLARDGARAYREAVGQ